MSGAAETAAPAITVYTVGHSRHTIGHFLALLEGHRISQVIDVRGQPFSRYNPQFNREKLRDSLVAAGIDYVWLGDRLSGRPQEPDFYGPDGKILWDRLRHWPALAEGIGEVLVRAGRGRAALVCAEENPRNCHRRHLLTPLLEERGARVLHVRGDGRVEPESELAAADAAEKSQLDLFGG